jgi:hypothetical protein
MMGRTLLGIVVIVVLMWAVSHHTYRDSHAPMQTAAHIITPDCVSGEDMARAYGWTGDWREFAYEIRRLNGWADWPFLHAGDEVIVPDYRTHRCANGGGSEGYAAAHRVPAAVTMPLTTNSSIRSTRPYRIEPTPGGPAPAMGITSAHRPGRPSYLEHRTHHPGADLLPPWGSSHHQGRAGNRAARPSILLDRVAGPPQHSSNGDTTQPPN